MAFWRLPISNEKKLRKLFGSICRDPSCARHPVFQTASFDELFLYEFHAAGLARLENTGGSPEVQGHELSDGGRFVFFLIFFCVSCLRVVIFLVVGGAALVG